jgi:tetratricopeptide (TPR) repeat protein
MGEPSNAVFISYRRDVGGTLAMALHQHLSSDDIDAFYDIESIRAGQFGTIILNQIAARPYFLLVLTPGTLDRCAEPSDWVRREIEKAFATHRIIVPVFTPNFDFSDLERFLPAALGEELARYNAQELPQRWFKYAVQQLTDEFLLLVELESAATPVADEAIVERIAQQARTAPSVTEIQLTAQEHFERAYASEDIETKIAEYDEAIRLNPDYSEAFNNRGNDRRAQGDLAGASADYDEPIRLDPGNAAAFNNRGTARYDRGDLAGAIADYDEAIRLDPGDATALYNRGNVRRVDGDLAGAIADFEAVRRDPGYADAVNNRGTAWYDQGDLAGAIADFDAAIRLDPGYAMALYNRGLVRQTQSDLAAAIADFEAGAAYAPNNPRLSRLSRRTESEEANVSTRRTAEAFARTGRLGACSASSCDPSAADHGLGDLLDHRVRRSS